MATHNVLETGGEWTTTSNWDNNVEPVDGENAYIPARLNADVAMSVSQSDIELDVWHIAKGYGYMCGSSGTPLEIGMNTLKVEGSIGFYLALHDAGVAIVNERAWVDVDASVPVLLNKHGSAHANTDYTLVRLINGNLTMGGAVTWASGGEVQVTGGMCTLAINGETLPKLTMSGGNVKSDVGVTEAVICGGTMVQDTVAIGTARVMPGATLDLRLGGTVISTIIHVERGGTLILDGSDDHKTIAEIHAPKGANLIYNPDMTTFTANYSEGRSL